MLYLPPRRKASGAPDQVRGDGKHAAQLVRQSPKPATLQAIPLRTLRCRAISILIELTNEANKLAFQPFGYRFEVTSTLTSAEVKTSIKSKKTNIFDAKNGARGWTVGPFICLWFSAFDRHGPMLFGLISANNFGTRVHGRAGSDLNGVAMFTLLIPLMGFLVFKMISLGQASGRQLLVLALVFLVGGPLIYWSAHKERKDAEPLVRFLRKALAQSANPSKSRVIVPTVHEGSRLLLNGDSLDGPVTHEAIENAFGRVGNRDFLVIESDAQNYFQTASRDGRYVIEIRKGGPDEHYRAIRKAVGGPAHSDDTFTYEEVSAAIASYVAGDSLPSFLQFQPMDPNQ